MIIPENYNIDTASNISPDEQTSNNPPTIPCKLQELPYNSSIDNDLANTAAENITDASDFINNFVSNSNINIGVGLINSGTKILLRRENDNEVKAIVVSSIAGVVTSRCLEISIIAIKGSSLTNPISALINTTVGALAQAIYGVVLYNSTVNTYLNDPQYNFQQEYDKALAQANRFGSSEIVINVGNASQSQIFSYLKYNGCLDLPENIKIFVKNDNNETFEVIRGTDFETLKTEVSSRGFNWDYYNQFGEAHPTDFFEFINSSGAKTDVRDRICYDTGTILNPHSPIILLKSDEKLYFPINGNDDDNEIHLDNIGRLSTGGKGNDIIIGGDGNDSIYGNYHPSTPVDYPGSDNDFLVGGGGDDWINGGADSDTIYGGSGNNTIYGGTGADEIYSNNANGVVISPESQYTNIVYGGNGNDTAFLKCA